MVYQVARKVKIPIVGCGGISSAEDALEFIMAGASAVQVGTANFIDPSTGVKVADGLKSFAEQQGLADVGQLVRAMQSDVKFSILQSWL